MIKSEWIELIRAAVGLPSGDGPELERFDRVIALAALAEARKIALEAPLATLGSRPLDSRIFWRRNGTLWTGTLMLPADFLRLSALRVQGWDTSIFEVCMPGSEEYWQRLSPYPEIAGSPSSPRVYFLNGQGCNSLEIHSAASGDSSLAEAAYIPEPSWESGLLPDSSAPRLIPAVAAAISSLMNISN